MKKVVMLDGSVKMVSAGCFHGMWVDCMNGVGNYVYDPCNDEIHEKKSSAKGTEKE